MTGGRRAPESALRAFAEAVLTGLGAPAESAVLVAACLVDADRRGVPSHGLVRLPSYCADVRAGRIVPDAVPCLVREDGPTALLDGCGGFGAVTGAAAMDEAVARAGRHGVGLVVARRCNHAGSLAFYGLRAAERGFVGVAAASTPAVMAPWGGTEARIGNNPLAVVAPMPDGRPPFAFDAAQSASSRGRMKLAELRGEPIPAGWALAPDGRPTTDAAEGLAGALLPSGGHKGYGLALTVEILAGVLAGGDLGPELVNESLTGSAGSGSATKTGPASSVHLAIDPGRFLDGDAFAERMGRLASLVTGAPPGPGAAEVVLPGELEARAAARSDALGIELEESTIVSLEELGRTERVPFPAATSP